METEKTCYSLHYRAVEYESFRQYGDPRIIPGTRAPCRADSGGISNNSPHGDTLFGTLTNRPRGRFLEAEASRAVVACRSAEAGATFALGEGGSCGVLPGRESSELQHSHGHEALRPRYHPCKRELHAEIASRTTG